MACIQCQWLTFILQDIGSSTSLSLKMVKSAHEPSGPCKDILYVLCSVKLVFIPQVEVNNSCNDIHRLPCASVLFGACARSIQAADLICLHLPPEKSNGCDKQRG